MNAFIEVGCRDLELVSELCIARDDVGVTERDRELAVPPESLDRRDLDFLGLNVRHLGSGEDIEPANRETHASHEQ